MKTVTASDANRHFSRILRDVSRGEEVTITSRGRALATIAPTRARRDHRVSAHRRLVARLRNQTASGTRDWKRDNLYEDAP